MHINTTVERDLMLEIRENSEVVTLAGLVFVALTHSLSKLTTLMCLVTPISNNKPERKNAANRGYAT